MIYQRGLKFFAGLVILLIYPFSAQAVVVTSGCVGAASCTLTELYAGGTIKINDVLFDSWILSFVDGDDVVDNGAITVSGVDEVPDGMDPTKADVGLDFDISPAIAFEFLEYDFDFRASMVATTRMLVGASLDLSDFSRTGDAFVEINSDLTPGGLLTVYENVDDGTTFDVLTFAATSTIDVDADIQMEIFDFGALASLSGFDYRFTVMEMQTPSPIPIPAAVWLFGTALIGLVGFGKRRKAV